MGLHMLEWARPGRPGAKTNDIHQNLGGVAVVASSAVRLLMWSCLLPSGYWRGQSVHFPHHAGEVYRTLVSVVARATRWREPSGRPFEWSVLRAYRDDDAEDNTLFINRVDPFLGRSWWWLRGWIVPQPWLRQERLLGYVWWYPSSRLSFLLFLIDSAASLLHNNGDHSGPWCDVVEFIDGGMKVVWCYRYVRVIRVLDVNIGFMFRVQSRRACNEGGWPNHGALNDAGVDPGDARCFTGKKLWRGLGRRTS